MKLTLLCAGILLIGVCLGLQVQRHDKQSHYPVVITHFSHPSAEVYARVNREANEYLGELVKTHSLSDGQRAECFIIPLTGGYTVEYRGLRNESDTADKIFALVNAAIEEKLVLTKEESGTEQRP